MKKDLTFLLLQIASTSPRYNWIFDICENPRGVLSKKILRSFSTSKSILDLIFKLDSISDLK